MPTNPNRVRRVLLSTAAVAGLSLGAAGVASAATSTSTPASSTASSSTAPSGAPTGAPAGAPSGAPDPSAMTHGPNETLLTGSDLASATAAAQAAEPGATIIRAETDSSGVGTYEVHMKKSDGSFVTVELDASFKVTSTVSGFGVGPAGSTPPSGAPAAGGPNAPTGQSGSTN